MQTIKYQLMKKTVYILALLCVRLSTAHTPPDPPPTHCCDTEYFYNCVPTYDDRIAFDDGCIVGAGEAIWLYTSPDCWDTYWVVTGDGMAIWNLFPWTAVFSKRQSGSINVKATPLFYTETCAEYNFPIVLPEEFEYDPPDPALDAVGKYWGWGYPLTPGENRIGTAHYFPDRIKPLFVSFYNLQLSENIPECELAFPRPITHVIDAERVLGGTWRYYNNGSDISKFDRIGTDLVGVDPFDITYLQEGSVGPYIDTAFATAVPLDYQDDNGNWINFNNTNYHYLEYNAFAQCRSGVGDVMSGESAGADWFGDGPWN